MHRFCAILNPGAGFGGIKFARKAGIAIIGCDTNRRYNRIFCAAVALGMILCTALMLFSEKYHQIIGNNGPQSAYLGLTDIDFDGGEVAYLDGV